MSRCRQGALNALVQAVGSSFSDNEYGVETEVREGKHESQNVRNGSQNELLRRPLFS